MVTSSSPIKVFFNEEIHKKYEEQFDSRPFIFEKYFDTKNEPNVVFTPEFMAVVKKHKWESFIQQRWEIYPDLVREFYAHLVTKHSPFLMIPGMCVRFDDGFINSMFDLSCVKDEQEVFVNSMTTAKRNKILADLCETSTTWTVSPKECRSVKRLALKSQARGWNHFLKDRLMYASHNETILKKRMDLLHSIITGQKINVGHIIVDETFKCVEKGTNNLFFPLLITNVYMRHNVPKMDSDEALVVKGTMIIATTWRQLTRAETKEKSKWKVSTPKLRAAKSVLMTPMPTDFVVMLTKDVAIQETIVSFSPGIMPAFPTFLVDLFVGDFSHSASPKAHSSSLSDAIESILSAVDESSKTATPPESKEV
ncbi:hypothetical protein V6N12_035831 [Hibiscus sabdariffa]|uniref:Putative plant transposon protein domain-containing protein n=1 Tax=Hibiscus sabdariffa TaxID=183260 RepID=A0ABR2EPB0_9ROSI